MCVTWTDKIRTAKKDIIAWKVCCNRESRWAPGQRMKQGKHKDKGKVLQYIIGNTLQSSIPETPGIYLYRDCEEWCIKVKIPAGTRYRRGRELNTPTINAETVVVLE